MKGLKNIIAYVSGQGICKTNIGIINGKIEYVGNDESVIDCEIANINDGIVVPGFIDRHVHGANGYDVMDGDEKCLNEISVALAKEGVTAFLPTTMTENILNIERALKNLSVKKNEVIGAKILGVHLEGPFISREYAGAQNVNDILPPSVEVFNKLNNASGNFIKLVTVGVEIDGGKELIKYLTKIGVKTSVGHSGAIYEQVLDMVSCGLNSVTHTFNAQNKGERGVSYSAVNIDKLYTEIICDLVHVSRENTRLLLDKKPSEKIILVSDSMRAKNMKDGVYTLGGNKVFVNDGQARNEEGRLAGSLLNMNIAVKNMVKEFNVPFENAIDFASKNVAESLGIEDLGKIEQGCYADFTVLDGDFNVLMTIKNGEVIYKK